MMTKTQKRAVFFDRDGVLNRTFVQEGQAYAPLTFQDFHIEPMAMGAVQRARAMGFFLCVITNQPELARGSLQQDQLLKMHQEIRKVLGIDSIYLCPHEDKDACTCRKPLPGLLQEAAFHHNLDLKRSYFIGDRWCDIEAAQAANCHGILLERSYSGDCRPHYRAKTLLEAIEYIGKRQKTEDG